jgi:hypothetical protein
MRPYLESWLVRAGLVILVLGTGPLFLIVAAAKLGLTDDPNPNPIGPGCLAGLTFMPGIVLLLVGIGVVAVEQRRRLHP